MCLLWGGIYCIDVSAYNYLPIVKCFDKDVYQAGRQNWDIGTDSHGIVYFGNTDGLLRNIYGDWQLTRTSNGDMVRSLCVENDTIWTGGVQEYGYFVKNGPGNLSYVQAGKVEGGQIWEIQAHKGKIYLQTEGAIIVYDKANKKGDNIYWGDGFFSIQTWNDKVWAITRNGSIGSIEGMEFKVKHQFDQLNGAEVRKLFIHDDQLNILLFDGRIYTFDGRSLRPQKLPHEIAGKAFFTGCSYDDQDYLVGTISDGLVQVNGTTGQITASVNSDNDLIDNTVLAIGQDINGNVWLGLDYGIAYVEMQSALKPIFNQGATYSIQDVGDFTYLATNKGLYFSSGDHPFQLIEGTEGQAWRLRYFNDQLHVCHNKGLLKVKGDQLEQVYLNEGVMDVAAFPGTNLYLFSAYSGLLLMKYDKGRFTFLENLNIWGNPKIVYDREKRCIWADSKWGSLTALSLDEDLKIVRNEYPEIVNFFKGEDRFVFYDGQQLSDFEDNSFEPISEAPFNTIQGENIVALDFDRHTNIVAYVKDGVPDMLASLHDGNFYSYKKLLSSLQSHLVENDEFIDIHQGELRIATDRGVTSFNVESNAKHALVSNAVISKVVVLQEDQEREEYTFPYRTDQLQLAAGEKNILFHFGIHKASSDLAEFRYRLWPYDKEWSEWDATKVLKEYTQLKGGVYKFSLQSRLNGGNEKEQSISFSIEKYWYQTKWVLLPILLLFLACILLTVRIMNRINRLKLTKAKKAHKQSMAAKTISMKNEQLLQYTEIISRKNEFLIEVKEGLGRMRNSEAKQWENKIMEEVNNEKKNFIFHKLFSELHQDFIDRLTQKHPSLTANDIRTLSFVRINLGTREIASLMNISPKSVDISRYRLRKKLELPREADLNQYIRDL